MPRMTICRSSLALVFALGLTAAAPAQGAKASAHTVKQGDTLWGIARTYLGDPSLWPQIYKLNTGVVEDPHWIYPGEVLNLEATAGQTAVPTTDTPPPTTQAPAAPAPAAAEPVVRAEAPMPAPTPLRLEPTQQDPRGGDDGMELFRRRRVANVSQAFAAYREVKYHPLRSGEFHAAGFLTEGQELPLGTLLGPVTPEQIESARSRAAVQIYTAVGVVAPAGASYSAGDTLLIVDRREGPVGYGEIIVPTGMLRITGSNGPQTVGEVIAVYGPIRDGQWVMPAEKFTDPGGVTLQKVSGGIEGRILAPRGSRDLRQLQEVLFIDIGRTNGVSAGDLFEVRRTAGPQDKSMADARDELMATVQVIHVRGRTATVKVVTVVSPDIKPGARVVQVAKLPS